jgi:hypothetical protein
MPQRYLQLAQQYLTQANQLHAASSKAPSPAVAQRQQVMAAQSLKKVVRHVEAALQRMGLQNVAEDDGSFG